jgi:hypothetical protein
MFYVELYGPLVALMLLVKLLPLELIVSAKMSRQLTRNGTKEMSLQVNVTLRNNIYI